MRAYVDSAVWINRFEGQSNYRKIVEDHFRLLSQDGWTLCVSEAVLLEVLFKPYRDKQQALIALYQGVFSQIDILPNYESVFQDALPIAQRENLRAMDSVHIAFASHYGCEKFVSTDRHFRNLETLPPHWIDL